MFMLKGMIFCKNWFLLSFLTNPLFLMYVDKRQINYKILSQITYDYERAS